MNYRIQKQLHALSSLMADYELNLGGTSLGYGE